MTAAALAVAVAGASPPVRAETPAAYVIRPSDVVPPSGTAPGGYERTIRPFPNWTVICDENIAAKTMVCNITQTIEDAAGRLVFSWSLAATDKGSPYMILRTAPVMPKDGRIRLDFAGRKTPVEVSIDGCNRSVCIGMVPVGPILRGQIAAKASPTISYPTTDGKRVSLEPTLAGLSDALSSIK